jgi:hypothetical protein
MPSQKRRIDEPAIREFLTGIKRGCKLYYRADLVTGRPIAFNARSELMKLASVSEATGSRLLREGAEAGLIETGFVVHESCLLRGQIATDEKSVLSDDIKVQHKADKMRVRCPKIRIAPVVSPKEVEEDAEEPEESTSRYQKSPMGLGDMKPEQINRFQLVKQGSWYGYWDDEYGYQELVSTDKEETLERIYQLQRQSSPDPFQWPTAKPAMAA